DGHFFAIDRDTGKQRWRFDIDPQPSISLGFPDHVTSDGGLITSSAWFEPGDGAHPDLVLFGGGFTMYALDAHTRALVWKQQHTGRPALPADPAHDEARIFSSPVVADGHVLFGVTPDGQNGHRGAVVADALYPDLPDHAGRTEWVFETDVNAG